MRRLRTRSTILVTLAVLGLAACGGSSDTAGDARASDAGATDDTSMDDSMDDGSMGGDMAMDEHMDLDFGESADAADADRTVTVEAHDNLTYDPPSLTVAAGEVITFEVTNAGAAVHEFVLGDAQLQEEHEAEMMEMMDSGMQMQDEPNAIAIQPGETKSLTFRFTTAGEYEFACHQPGHYAGGMKGTITVS